MRPTLDVSCVSRKTPDFTPFGKSLSSVFSPTPTQVTKHGNFFAPLGLHNDDPSISLEDIMKSSFVPTPKKVDSTFSPGPKVNLASILSSKHIHDNSPVPVSMDKKRKIEEVGGYFKRMGSPTIGGNKENKPQRRNIMVSLP